MAILFPCKLEPKAASVYSYLKDLANFHKEELTILYTYEDYYFRRMFGTSKVKKFAWNKLRVFGKGREKQVPSHVILRLRSGKLKEQTSLALQKETYTVLAQNNEQFEYYFRKGNLINLKNREGNCQLIFIPYNKKWQTPKNILIFGGDIQSLNALEQQQILSLGIQYNCNLHYLNPEEEGESWTFNSKPLTADRLIYEKSFPSENTIEVMGDYLINNEIDFVILSNQGMDLFEDWVKTLRPNQELNRTVLLLKNPKKSETKRRFENFLPKTWNKKPSTGSPHEEPYNPKELKDDQ
jgi:hypothetical protein